MMNKGNGFTLIEVLAVICVLGLILIIAVPKLTNTVYMSKKNVFKLNASSYMSEAKKIYQNKYAGSLKNNIVYKVVNGKLYDDEVEIDVINGSFDGNGFVQIYENGNVKLSIKNDEFCATKDLNSNEVIVNDYNKDDSCGEIYIPLYVELNGGESTQEFDDEYIIGTKIELVDPTNKNGDFVKWEVVKGNSTLVDNILTIGDKETIIYAVWEAKFKLDVDLDGGSETDKSGIYASGTVIDLGTPEKEGYTFTGWEKVDGSGTLSGNTFIIGDSDAVVKAKYSANTYQYNIEYKSESGLLLETDTVSYNFDTINEIKPKTFNGYTSPSSQSIKWDSVNIKTITFTYSLIDYVVIINLDGGSGVENIEYTIETDTFTLEVPTKTGYAFTGWTGSNGNEPNKNVSIEKGSTGNKEYIANWQILNPVYAYSCKSTNSGSSYVFTYTGDCEMIDDGNGNWRVRFLSGGDFISNIDMSIDAFLVGGGGGGGSSDSAYRSSNHSMYNAGGSGGGGGYGKTVTNIAIEANEKYTIVIGAGGNPSAAGGTTSGFSVSASGGGAGGNAARSDVFTCTTAGGSGGNAGGRGGGWTKLNSGDLNSAAKGGSGATACREFGSTSGTAYCGGGGGGAHSGSGAAGGSGGGGNGGAKGSAGKAGTANTGGGGGGGGASGQHYVKISGGKGGSGIVIIRNKR